MSGHREPEPNKDPIVHRKRNQAIKTFVCLAVLLAAAAASAQAAASPGDRPEERIKSFCLDFNWVFGPHLRFAPPGTFANADPKVHYQWYKDLGVNVIQAFCVTCNGYAWYREARWLRSNLG